MALTGIGLLGFLIAHLSGNLLIYAGPEKFNHYAEFLEANPLLVPAEIGLLVLFFYHIYLAITLTRENEAARPIPYQQRKTNGESTFASRTMIYTGTIILAFVIVHVYMFKFGAKKNNGQMVLWELVVENFKNPLVVAWYVIAMITLGFHLSHGTSSVLQSLGIIKSDWRGGSRTIGAIIGWAIAIGFALMPIYVIVVKPTGAPAFATSASSASALPAAAVPNEAGQPK